MCVEMSCPKFYNLTNISGLDLIRTKGQYNFPVLQQSDNRNIPGQL